MIIVGVDPGAHGALTLLNTYSYRSTQAIPLAKNTLSDIVLFLSGIRGGEPHRSIEDNHKCPIYSPAKIHRAETYPINIDRVESIMTPILHPLGEGEEYYDNTMEIWLEEPGQIIPAGGANADKNTTGRLLAGMTASRKLGRSVGQWEGIAAALNVNVVLVPPKKWQKALNCKTGGNKNISKNMAKSLFPFLNKNGRITHDVADSLLIAMYGYLHYADRQYISPIVHKTIQLNQVYSNLIERPTNGRSKIRPKPRPRKPPRSNRSSPTIR